LGGEFNWTTIEGVGGTVEGTVGDTVRETVGSVDAVDAMGAMDAMDAREAVKEPEVCRGNGQPHASVPTHKRTGWVMDNRSSYVANRATGVLKKSFLTVLLAPTEKV